MNPIGYGCDVSYYQAPSVIDALAGKVDFVICRAAYGTAVDKRVSEHAERVRAIGAKLGLYQFFRNIQDVGAQFDALRTVADAIGYGAGDIVPAVDIELDPFPTKRPVDPNWSGPAEELVGKLVEAFGDAMVYITRREFGFMGLPTWVLVRPLWVSHYTGDAAPATPGGLTPTIWQHYVGPFQRFHPGGYCEPNPALDQDRLIQPLPLIAAKPPELTDEDRARIAGLVSLTAEQAADDAFRSARRAGELAA